MARAQGAPFFWLSALTSRQPLYPAIKCQTTQEVQEEWRAGTVNFF